MDGCDGSVCAGFGGLLPGTLQDLQQQLDLVPRIAARRAAAIGSATRDSSATRDAPAIVDSNCNRCQMISIQLQLCTMAQGCPSALGAPLASATPRSAPLALRSHCVAVCDSRPCTWGLQHRQKRKRLSPAASLSPEALHLLQGIGGLHHHTSHTITQAAGVWQQLGAAPPPLPPPLPPLIADLVTALGPACFDAACQSQKDSLLIAR